MTTTLPALSPLLVVRDAARAVDFYVSALGAIETARYIDRRKDAVAHADLLVGDEPFSITEESRAWNSDAPVSLGGSPVVLQLRVQDVDALFERMCRAGSKVVFPIVELFGQRMVRLRDPFGHLWLLSQRLEELSVSEIQRQRDAWAPPEALSRTSASLAAGPAPEQEPAREGRRRAPRRVHPSFGPIVRRPAWSSGTSDVPRAGWSGSEGSRSFRGSIYCFVNTSAPTGPVVEAG